MLKYRSIDFKTVGKNIKQERLMQSLSRETLGGMANISGATIGNIETDAEKVLFKNIVAIAKALDVSLVELLY